MAKSVERDLSLSLKPDAFTVSHFIHESEHARYLHELSSELLPFTDRTHRNSDFPKPGHSRFDSKSSFILHKERRQIPGLSINHHRDNSLSRQPDASEDLKDPLGRRRYRRERMDTGSLAQRKLNFSEISDTNATPMERSGSPRLKIRLDRKDRNRDVSRESLGTPKRDLTCLGHKSALNSLISRCKVTECSGKAELKALEQSKDTESKLLKKFLDTVTYLQDIDLYESRILPKVYTEKVKQEEFVKKEEANILREFRIHKNDPWRPSVRLSLRRRKLHVEL